MSLDLVAFGKKLERYRLQFQMSQEDISKSTGIAEALVRSYEAGEVEPSGDHILILADFFKCDYKFFISNEKLAPFEQTETLFRAHGDQLSPTDRWAIQEFLYLCECESMLSASLDRTTDTFRFAKSGSFFKKHGADAAVALRRHLRYEGNQVPMDVFADFRNIGLHVFRRHLENSTISGLFIRHPLAGDCVLVNYSEDVYRQRFTVAHEAGHAILDTDREVNLSLTSWDSSDLSEIRANVFASHFLMPPEFLAGIPNVDQWDAAKAIEWANRLKVSTHALSLALSQAKLVDSGSASVIRNAKVPQADKQDAELPSTLSQRTRDLKRQFLERGLSTHYVSLCFDAYEADMITAGKLAEALLSDMHAIQQIADVFGRSLKYGD